MDNVAGGAPHLIDSGMADSKRLALGGGSHGGTMVGYAVTSILTYLQLLSSSTAWLIWQRSLNAPIAFQQFVGP